MKECREYREQFLEAAYGELDDANRRRLNNHLAVCPSCSGEFEDLEETVRVIQARVRPEPPAAFWESTWTRFMSRLDRESAVPARIPRWGRFWSLRIAAAAALILVGVFIGRFWKDRESLPLEAGMPESPAGEAARATELDARVDRYLERSKLILLGLANLDPTQQDVHGFDFTPERDASRALIRETGSLRDDLEDARERRLLELLTELEVVLLQISNLQDDGTLLGLELAITGIDRRALLLKIYLEEIRRSQRSPESQRSVG